MEGEEGKEGGGENERKAERKEGTWKERMNENEKWKNQTSPILSSSLPSSFLHSPDKTPIERVDVMSPSIEKAVPSLSVPSLKSPPSDLAKNVVQPLIDLDPWLEPSRGALNYR